MALHWNLEKIENWKQLFNEKGEFENSRMKFVYETILMRTMSVGIRTITEKNWKQFYARVQMLEKIRGTGYYTDDIRPIYTTQEDVKRMIGLWTNASEFSKTEFLKRLSSGFAI
jgi:hypothetical protein